MKYPCPKCGIQLDKRGGWKHEKHCDGNQPTRRKAGVPSSVGGVYPPQAAPSATRVSKPDRSAKKPRIQSAPTTAAATPALANPITAAVRALADSLVQFVLAEVTQSLQSSVVSLAVPGVAAPLRGVGRVPEQKQPAADTAAATPNGLHTLSDQQLKDRLGVAKAANNLGLCAKITNVLRMRDRSATVIANTHQEEM